MGSSPRYEVYTWAITVWNLPPPPGFQGFREDLPLKIYEQLLPHWRQDGATYFVTFRLGDSLPQSKLNELRRMRAEWERRHPPPRSKEDLETISRTIFARMEKWLDRGYGSCLLRRSELAAHLVKEMHDSHNDVYELGCYVIMPNHVHAIVRPLRPTQQTLEDILRTWKGASSTSINFQRGVHEPLWQRETFDRIIRDEEHLYRVIQYIRRNPIRANLPPGMAVTWINPTWEALGWRFEAN